MFDDQLELIFGPDINGKPLERGVPPFYISLSIHDKIPHNVMLDSGASHNLMPKSVMEKLNLDITRPYKNLISFDSSQLHCLGLIKDLCVTLVQYQKASLWILYLLTSHQSMACYYPDHGGKNFRDPYD